MNDAQVLHRDDLPVGGFAGLREHRVVVDPRAFGPQPPTGGWPGIGNLISVVAEGRIGHEGSLGHRLARTACQKPL